MPDDPSPCPHHWVIPAAPAEPVGVCRVCRATRRFRNWDPEATAWERGGLARSLDDEYLPLNEIPRAALRRSR